jgi:hypothetical protein
VLVGTVVVAGAVVVGALVVGPEVVGGAVVVGPTVVGAAVTVGWVVVAPTVEGVVVVVVSLTAAGASAAAGESVEVGPPITPCPGPEVVDGGGSLVGSRRAAVVEVDAGLVDKVGCATSGPRRGG